MVTTHKPYTKYFLSKVLNDISVGAINFKLKLIKQTQV